MFRQRCGTIRTALYKEDSAVWRMTGEYVSEVGGGESGEGSGWRLGEQLLQYCSGIDSHSDSLTLCLNGKK